ncbi:trigger factor [Suttonella ornithocola]|uniref:Trigger factor n=1 Tax=Suttonella ornithocola TaxID=279832 RepID=A0A380N027_9GAMM|nr:trigger factor [Suttonella ornithocola]SUO97483.1 Trigger factor [Suttonella ornithocola]
MESSIEKLDGLAHKITIEVPAEKIDHATIERLKALRPRVRVDGFRPGKVPPHIMKQRYGESARQDVLEDEIEIAYREAIGKTDLSPVAPPKIELISGFKEGEPLKFSATFEVMPEIEVKGLDTLEITLPKSEIQDKDVEEMVQTLRRQQATFHENAEKTTAENDRVTVDFIGKIDGEAFEGGSGENVAVLIGGGQMLPDFEDGLKGAKLGEEKTFDVQFPENYPSEQLAGKTAQFTATVKKIEEMYLPELDAKFIENFGIDGNNEEAFKKAIRENMERELENALRRIRRERMFDAILEHNTDLAIPHSALDQEMNRMGEEINLSKQVPDHEQRHQILHQLFEPQAKRRLQLGFLLSQLFEERNIELDQERVDARLASIASTYEDPEEVKAWYKNDKQAKINLESAILEEQLIDQLYEKAKVSDEDKTFQEVMAINSQIRN